MRFKMKKSRKLRMGKEEEEMEAQDKVEMKKRKNWMDTRLVHSHSGGLGQGKPYQAFWSRQ